MSTRPQPTRSRAFVALVLLHPQPGGLRVEDLSRPLVTHFPIRRGGRPRPGTVNCFVVPVHVAQARWTTMTMVWNVLPGIRSMATLDVLKVLGTFERHQFLGNNLSYCLLVLERPDANLQSP